MQGARRRPPLPLRTGDPAGSRVSDRALARREMVAPGSDRIRAMDRRAFLAATALAGCSLPQPRPDHDGIPGYLAGQRPDFKTNPHGAGMAWFRSVRLGLHLEYGVHTQLGRGPAVQFEDRIPPSDYVKLKHGFDASAFNAPALADLAKEAGFQYLGLTVRHSDGFCLFRTTATEFNALEVTGRDLLAEIGEACSQRSLGLIVSFSYAADWRHPYFYPAQSSQTEWRGARPAYDTTPPEYRFARDEDFQLYVRDVHHQIQEIAYRYWPLAGIRLEPDEGYFARPDLFPVGQAYALIREASPGTLIAFGAGANGEEDFCALSHLRPETPPTLLAASVWERNRDKPREVAVRLDGGERMANGPTHGRSGPFPTKLLLVVALRADGSLAPDDRRGIAEFAAQSSAA